jgi:hypothetical protein
MNRLALEAVSHRRNLMGPFHMVEPTPHWTGPGSFRVEADRSRPGYHLVPCGIKEAWLERR